MTASRALVNGYLPRICPLTAACQRCWEQILVPTKLRAQASRLFSAKKVDLPTEAFSISHLCYLTSLSDSILRACADLLRATYSINLKKDEEY